MAVYYYLAVACADRLAAAAVAARFDGLTLALSDGLSIRCRADSLQDWAGAWWCSVRPYGASLNAFDAAGQPEPNLTTRAQRSEIGHLLYQHLRAAPPFRYALFGAEALEQFFDVHSVYNRVLREPKIIADGWAGLVIDLALWEQTGRSPHYEPFGPDHVWQPYRGEDQW